MVYFAQVHRPRVSNFSPDRSVCGTGSGTFTDAADPREALIRSVRALQAAATDGAGPAVPSPLGAIPRSLINSYERSNPLRSSNRLRAAAPSACGSRGGMLLRLLLPTLVVLLALAGSMSTLSSNPVVHVNVESNSSALSMAFLRVLP